MVTKHYASVSGKGIAAGYNSPKATVKRSSGGWGCLVVTILAALPILGIVAANMRP